MSVGAGAGAGVGVGVGGCGCGCGCGVQTPKQKSKKKKKELRGPGIEPGSTAWKAAMLTITPAALSLLILVLIVSILEEL